VSLGAAVAAATGVSAETLTPVAGGDINRAFRAELADGRTAFVKTRRDAPAGEYAAEAAALAWLAEPGGLPIPAVLGVHDPPAIGDSAAGEPPRVLVLEWLEADGSGGDPAALGRGLAALHAAGAERFGAAPGGRDLRIGSIVLSNDPAPGWPRFYAERRLLPLAGAARDNGSLSAAGLRAVEALCERIGELAGPPEPPARLHGDLWSGNVLWSGGRPYLIDPAAYGGHREVDLAMLRLFGSPGPAFLNAYEAVAPLAAGHEERVDLWQLFPLLVHAVLFGGGYGASAERAARRYVS
jgi:fructosamine-3-kinase